MIILNILLSCVYCYGGNSDIEHTAAQMLNFQEEISITTEDLNAYMKRVFEYEPRLEFYYGGYSDLKMGNYHKVKFQYNNINTDIMDIAVAKSKDELMYILSSAILYCNDDVNVITDSNYNIEDIVKNIVNDNQIVVMGYNGFKATTFKSLLTDNTCFSIDLNYSIDTNTLLNYKKASENKAIEIISNNICKSMPDYMKEKIIHDYITEYTDYSNEDGDIAYMPYDVLINRKGVCSAYAGSAKIIFDLLGIENYYVSGTATNSETTEKHGWNIIKLDDAYYNLDVTWDDPVPVFGFNSVEYNYYNVTDEQLGKDHVWEREGYPVCNGTKYSYENVKKLINENEITYSDYYQRSDFVSVFQKYKPLNEHISVNTTEYVTEPTTEKTWANNIINIYNEFENLPDKYKAEIFIIIALILFVIFIK